MIDAMLWNNIMNGARVVAGLRGERVKVRAGKLSPRSARVTGRRYDYVIMNDRTHEVLDVEVMERVRAAHKKKWGWS